MVLKGQSVEAQQQLIEAAQRGSVAAFEQLIISVERQILAVAAGLAVYPDEADDIYQESVINAYRALPKFRADSQFSTWLYRIVINTALSYRRTLSHRFSRYINPENEAETPAEHYLYLSPQRNAENHQLNRAIGQAVNTLSDQERVVFVLCHQQQNTIAEAAAIMACSEGAVKSYLFRARDKLRKQLREYQI